MMNAQGTRWWMGALAVAAVLTVGPHPAQAQEARGYLGLQIQCSLCEHRCAACDEDGDADAAAWSFTYPPVIRKVTDGSPAEEAGLQAGDTIVEIDGIDITSTEGGRRFGMMAAGVSITLAVRRDGRTRTIQATPAAYTEVFGGTELSGDWEQLRQRVMELVRQHMSLQQALRETEQRLREQQAVAQQAVTEGQRRAVLQLRRQIDSIRSEIITASVRMKPHLDSLAVRTLTPPRPKLPELRLPQPETPEPGSITVIGPYGNAVAGAQFQELNEALASYFPGTRSGLLVVKVVEETPAYIAGLREGDVVVSAAGRPIETVEDLRRALSDDGEVRLEYVRKGKKQNCTISSK